MRSEGWKGVYLACIAMMTLAVEGQVIYISIGGPGVVRDCTTECKNTSYTCDFPTEPVYISSDCQVTIMAGDYTGRTLEIGGNTTAVSITVTAQQNVTGLMYKSATSTSLNGGVEMFVGDMAHHRLRGYWVNVTLSISTEGFITIITPRMTLNPGVVHLLQSESVTIGDASVASVISHASPSSLPFAFELLPASSLLSTLTFYEIDISLTHGFTQSTVRYFYMSYSSANVSSIFGGMRSSLPSINLQYSTLYGLTEGFGFTNTSEVLPELVSVRTKNVTIDRSGQGSSSLPPLLPPGIVSGVLEIKGHCLGCEFSLNITSSLYINGRCDSPIKIHFPNSGSSRPSVTLNGTFSRASTPKAGDPPMLALTATRQITFDLPSFETSVIYDALSFVSGDLESSLGLCDMILSNITAPMSYLSVNTLCIGSRVAIGPCLNISKKLLDAGLPGPTNLTSVSSSTDSIWRLGPIEYDINVHANASIEYWTSNTSSGIRNTSSTVSFSLVLPQIHIVWNDTDTPKPFTSYPLINSFRNLSGATVSSNSPYEVRYDEISQSLFWTYTPISPVLPCLSTQPDPAFDCIDGEWQSFTPIDKATFSVPPASGRLVIQGSMRITDSLVFNGLGSSIAVNGCTSITGKVSLSLSEAEYKRISETSNSADSSRTVLVSQARGCAVGLDTIAVAVSHPDFGCKKVKSRNYGDQDSLALLFRVDSSTCNTKWIILGSVLGGVLVIIVIILSLLFTLNPKARAIVRPYADRSNRKAAVM